MRMLYEKVQSGVVEGQLSYLFYKNWNTISSQFVYWLNPLSHEWLNLWVSSSTEAQWLKFNEMRKTMASQ